MEDFNARLHAELGRGPRRADGTPVDEARTASARRAERLTARPDRIALWAFFLALAVTLIAAASSQAASGGIADPSSEPEETSCEAAKLGKRKLERGDCGTDVKTLNAILKSKRYERGVRGKRFKDSTETTVRRFQKKRGLNSNGVANRRTQKALVRSMNRSRATWYGPGFWGNRTACGQSLKRKTVGVAHKKLPCGTKVTFAYRGKFLTTKVIDRGPYANGAKWDFTQRAAKKLGFEATDDVRAAVVRR